MIDGTKNEVPLGELGVLDRGKSRHRPRYAHHLYGGDYPFIQTGDIKSSNGRIVSYEQTYSEAGLAQSRIWDAGTLCITIAANIGETAILTFPACFPDSVVGFISDEELAHTPYIAYALRYLRDRMQRDASGSAQDNINLEYLRNLEVPVFPVHTQKAIAHILGTLDDKIELNQKMNQTLEDIAKAIFKSWFVDFDPVLAKAEGRPTGLPSEISDLFPDELVDLEIGEVPKGWNLASIDEACEKVYTGGTPSTKVPEYWGGSHGWLSSGETGSAFIIDTEKKITEAGIENSSTKAALRFDTVIASAGQGKTRGQTSLLLLNTYVNQSVVTLRAKTEIGALLLFFNLSRRYEEFRRYSDSSSSRGSLTTTLLKELPFVIPTERLTIVFHKAILPMVEKIELNLREILVLSELRDTLLPKLISGELRISDAEKFLKKAGL